MSIAHSNVMLRYNGYFSSRVEALVRKPRWLPQEVKNWRMLPTASQMWVSMGVWERWFLCERRDIHGISAVDQCLGSWPLLSREAWCSTVQDWRIYLQPMGREQLADKWMPAPMEAFASVDDPCYSTGLAGRIDTLSHKVLECSFYTFFFLWNQWVLPLLSH